LAKPCPAGSEQLAAGRDPLNLRIEVFGFPALFTFYVSFFNAMRYALCAMLTQWTKIN
jgi:hypothetical protein